MIIQKTRFARSQKTGLYLTSTGCTARYARHAQPLPESTDLADLELIWGKGMQIVEMDQYQLARDYIRATERDHTCKQGIWHFLHLAAVRREQIFRKITVPNYPHDPAYVTIDGTEFALILKEGKLCTDYLH